MMTPQEIGADGQLVIPEELLEAAGIEPGSLVDLVVDGSDIKIVPRRTVINGRVIKSWRDLGGVFADGPDMAAQLLEDRARERD